MVTMMLKMDPNLWRRTYEDGMTAFHMAARRYDDEGPEILEALVDAAGLEGLEMRDNSGKLPLDTAEERWNEGVVQWVKWMLEKKPDLRQVASLRENIKKAIEESDAAALEAAFPDLSPEQIEQALRFGRWQWGEQKYEATHSAIHLAAMTCSNSEVFEMLLDNRSHLLRLKDKRNGTPLHIAAAERGSVDVVKAMLRMDPDLWRITTDGSKTYRSTGGASFDVSGQTAFHKAASRRESGGVQILEALAEVAGLEGLELRESWRATALHDAAASGNAGVVKAILKMHPDLWRVSDDSGFRAIQEALCQKEEGLQALEALVEVAGPEALEVKDSEGATALHHVATSDTVKSVKALLKMHPNLWRVQDNFGHSAFHMAASLGDEGLQMLETLVEEAGVEGLILQDQAGRTPLHTVPWEQRKEYSTGGPTSGPTSLAYRRAVAIAGIVEWIVKKNPDVLSKADREGRTPLVYAITHNPRALAAMLREAGGFVIAELLMREKFDRIFMDDMLPMILPSLQGAMAQYLRHRSKFPNLHSIRFCSYIRQLVQQRPRDSLTEQPLLSRDARIWSGRHDDAVFCLMVRELAKVGDWMESFAASQCAQSDQFIFQRSLVGWEMD
mmetsp:Transcript_42113/g.105179  ORF Transcript_42113/g.105179 Transcript_42113/m.105179 type:complete len:615 (-) Transcript_42113:1733-3577(-)